MLASSNAAGTRWESRQAQRLTSLLTAAALTGATFVAAAPAQSQELVDVIVRASADQVETARQLVARLGGDVERDLGIINGFSANVPAGALASLRANDSVAAVTPDTQVRLQSTLTDAALLITGTETSPTLDVIAPRTDEPVLEPVLIDEPVLEPLPVLEKLPVLAPAGGRGDLGLVAESIGADQLHAKGIDGAGIDIALIDSGVVPVAGLAGNNVVHGPDLSFEAGYAPVTNLDTFGHGTHMAGIMVANGGEAEGIAPGARVVSVKVADATGATDVSQVIAGIDWVVQNRNTDGRNIRVLNLSFGTDSTQGYTLDPLAYAAEVAWHNGIVTVVSAGNHGTDLGRLANPAINPWVIAVGASDTLGTPSPSDDTVPSFSAWGADDRRPDFVAPGRSVESLRSPGSWIDTNFATAQVGRTMFKGSGTSQAAAVTSGAVALLLQARPELSPDEVKYLLKNMAVNLDESENNLVGSGALAVDRAATGRVHHRHSQQKHAESTGTGSLEAARGSHHVEIDGEVLTGEVTANGSTWAGSTWAGSTWAGSQWNGSTWAGSTWAGSTWAGSTWAGSTWAGSTWAGSTWAGSTWAGSTWAGSTWASTAFWAGLRWD